VFPFFLLADIFSFLFERDDSNISQPSLFGIVSPSPSPLGGPPGFGEWELTRKPFFFSLPFDEMVFHYITRRVRRIYLWAQVDNFCSFPYRAYADFPLLVLPYPPSDFLMMPFRSGFLPFLPFPAGLTASFVAVFFLQRKDFVPLTPGGNSLVRDRGGPFPERFSHRDLLMPERASPPP